MSRVICKFQKTMNEGTIECLSSLIALPMGQSHNIFPAIVCESCLFANKEAIAREASTTTVVSKSAGCCGQKSAEQIERIKAAQASRASRVNRVKSHHNHKHGDED